MDNYKRMYKAYYKERLNLRSKQPKHNRSAAHRRPFEGSVSSLYEGWSENFVCDQLNSGNCFSALSIVDNFRRDCPAISAGKLLRGCDRVQIVETATFGNKVLPKRVKVDNGSKFIS